MKTKLFFMICLFLGIGLTQLSAQNGKNGIGAVSLNFHWDDYWVDVPVNCDNQVIDRLTGWADQHIVLYFKDGNFLWGRAKFKGEVESQSGEKFTINDVLKGDAITMIDYGHFNAIGDQGTHYIITYLFNENTQTMTIVKAACPGSDD